MGIQVAGPQLNCIGRVYGGEAKKHHQIPWEFMEFSFKKTEDSPDFRPDHLVPRLLFQCLQCILVQAIAIALPVNRDRLSP